MKPGIANAMKACAATLLLAWLVGPAVADEASTLPFAEFREAVERAADQRQVAVVYFTADWCTWCQRMEQVGFRDERVLGQADAFQWAKVDIDRQPYLSGAFGIRGVPAMALLNAHGELLEMREGYVIPDTLTALLETYADQAEEPGRLRRDLTAVTQTARRLMDADDQAVDEAVLEALAMLADREVAGQELAKRSVLDLGKRAWPALATALTDERLALRAAAYELLVEATEAELAFDPFAEKDERVDMALRWQAWVQQQVEPAVEPVTERDVTGERAADE